MIGRGCLSVREELSPTKGNCYFAADGGQAGGLMLADGFG